MRIINKLYCFFILLPVLASSQVLYDNFETPSGIRYHGSGLFRDTINSLSKGLNISKRIAKYSKSGNSGDLINVRLNRKIADVSAYAKSGKKMHMFFYSYSPGTEVCITFFDSTKVKRKKIDSGKHSEYRAITRRKNQWEVIYFDFVRAPDPGISPLNINKMIITIEPGKTPPSIYYFDDFYGPEFIGWETSESR